MPFDPLTQFLGWFMQHTLPQLQAQAVYDYGPIRSLVLYRDAEFQVELFTIAPGSGFAEEHRHPDVDSYEVHVCGEIQLTLNGQDSVPTAIPTGEGRVQYITRVRETDWHGARPIPGGGAFLSVQRWLHGVTPTSVGLNWDGTPPSPEHAALLAQHAAD